MASTSISVLSLQQTSRNWLELPPELTASIMLRVGTVDVLLIARRVCKTWRRICSDSAMWRVVEIWHSDILYFAKANPEYDVFSVMEKVAKQAVDLSCGEMIDLSLQYIGSDNLLRYISDRSCQLRRLRLVYSVGITDEGFSEMIRKLPLLEELHLFYIPLSKQAIEVAGHCCPQLKSFSLNKEGSKFRHDECDEEALAIAENMPKLRHLQLFGNKMTSDGLLAILEKCLHLESFDMRQCFNASYLGHDLARRLSQQIKDFRLPYDSTEDYEFDAEIFDVFDEDYPCGLSDIETIFDDYNN